MKIALAVLPLALICACATPPITYESLSSDLAGYDVVFLGEKHDNSTGHALERRILERLHARRGDIVLSLEMFERDVQKQLDDYLAGNVDEKTFLAGARPWPNYATDYRPMVEYCKAHGIPVVAANAPRPLASKVAASGFDAVKGDPNIAAETTAPKDTYWKNFVAEMGDHAGVTEANMLRFYQAQCAKDDTMAESIVRRFEGTARPLVVHVAGSFHVEHHLGTVARVHSRRPELRLAVVTMDEKRNVFGDGADSWRMQVASEPSDEEMEKVPARKAVAHPAVPPSGTDPQAKAPVASHGRPALGFMPDYDAGVEGCRVSMVREGGPAETAGLKEGDVIVKIGEVPIAAVQDYMEALGNLDVGSTVQVTVVRGTEKKTFDVKVGERIQ